MANIGSRWAPSPVVDSLTPYRMSAVDVSGLLNQFVPGGGVSGALAPDVPSQDGLPSVSQAAGALSNLGFIANPLGSVPGIATAAVTGKGNPNSISGMIGNSINAGVLGLLGMLGFSVDTTAPAIANSEDMSLGFSVDPGISAVSAGDDSDSGADGFDLGDLGDLGGNVGGED